MKPILITGATGFLGKYVVEQLRGRPLRLLCRGKSAWDNHPSIEVIRGDVTDAATVDRAVAGTDAVYHLAGLVSRDPAMSAEMNRVHVESTRFICESAMQHGALRVVLASSSGTIAVSKEPKVHDESSGEKTAVVEQWPYYLSKIRAERVALEYYRRDHLPVVIVNPALLLGPGDDRGSSTGDVRWFLEGQMLSRPPGGMSFVDARDAAAGVIAAMERGRPGERYLLGGVNWTFSHLMTAVGAVAGMRAPLLMMPTSLALKAAPLLRKLMPLVGRRFDFDDETIEMSGYFWYCDSSKAARELGYTTRDPMETLRDTVADLKARMHQTQEK
jgi:dihydroflavonol-4-reductase